MGAEDFIFNGHHLQMNHLKDKTQEIVRKIIYSCILLLLYVILDSICWEWYEHEIGIHKNRVRFLNQPNLLKIINFNKINQIKCKIPTSETINL